MRKIAVFASGFGSNFQAIINSVKQKHMNAEIALLISDNPNSLAVERARNEGIEAYAFHPRRFSSKQEYEHEILKRLKERKVELLVLAGYMRIIGETLLQSYPNRIINIHPSLLPKYKGKDAIGQAIEAHEEITGVTVHYVNQELDSGKIILQESLDISHIHSKSEIEAKIHKIEHVIYPIAIKKVLEELNENSID